MIINPIDKAQQQLVQLATRKYLEKARKLYNVDFSNITVRFDLKGRAAGMYCVKNNSHSIRYNPYIFAKYFHDNISTTVPHEVAHYVTNMLFPTRRTKPHGIEWRNVMSDFGVKPRVTGQYDLNGIPVKKQKLFTYRCSCTTHKLSTTRHNKIQSDTARYHCRSCGSVINKL